MKPASIPVCLTSQPQLRCPQSGDDGVGTGAIVGIVIAVLVFFGSVAAIFIFSGGGGDGAGSAAKAKTEFAPGFDAKNTDSNGFEEKNGVFSFELPDVE